MTRLTARDAEWALLAAVVLGAGVLRFYDLGSLPTGLHGDEAVSGLEGRRVLDDGWIGIYSPGALGQAAAPFYGTAVALKVFGETVFGVRAAAALSGTLAVLALYFLVRRELGGRVAFTAAALFALVDWHLHYSRIAYPLALWPLVVVLAAWCLVNAWRTRSLWWCGAAGAAAGFGIYVYNGHTLFLAIMLALAAFAVVRNREALWRQAAVFAAAGALVVLPMAIFAAQPDNGYFNHLRAVSYFRQPEWRDARSTGRRADLLAGRYFGYWRDLCCASTVNGVDAAGVIPLVPLTLLVCAGAGVLVAVVRHRDRALTWLGLLVLVVAPVGAVATIDGPARRTYLLAPFLVVFAALALVELAGPLPARVALVPAVLAVLLVAYQSTYRYFTDFRDSPDQRWVFAADLVAATRFMKTLPAQTHVYFLSDRWSFDYETRRFLAPRLSGEDRSREFGRRTDLAVPTQRPGAFVFLGAYTRDLPLVRSRYRGFAVTRPAFAAYVLRR